MLSSLEISHNLKTSMPKFPKHWEGEGYNTSLSFGVDFDTSLGKPQSYFSYICFFKY